MRKQKIADRAAEVIRKVCVETIGLSEPEVVWHDLPGKMLRIYVISDDFAEFFPSELQRIFWRSLQENLISLEYLRISMIAPITRDEYQAMFY